jgi:hypothetical protein
VAEDKSAGGNDPYVRFGSWPCQNGLKDVGPGSQQPEVVSSRDRCDQRRGPDNVHDPGQIVGQNDEPFRGYFWKRFGEKVRRSHADLYRAERMFDCFSPPAIKGKPDRDRSIERV